MEPIEDEPNVDARRAEMGLMPLEEYRKFLRRVYYPDRADNNTGPPGEQAAPAGDNATAGDNARAEDNARAGGGAKAGGNR